MSDFEKELEQMTQEMGDEPEVKLPSLDSMLKLCEYYQNGSMRLPKKGKLALKKLSSSLKFDT